MSQIHCQPAPRATPVVTVLFRALAFPAALGLATLPAQAAEEEREAASVLQAVQVQPSADASKSGLSPVYAGGQVAEGGQMGILGTQSVLGTPYNFTSYTETLIRDQQAASIGEVLLNDPSVRVARGFGNFQQVYLVRGLPVYSDDMTYNGLYGLLPRQYLAAEFIERAEVLRGANTFIKGAAPGNSGLGGGVNIVPKRAPNEPINQVTLGGQTGVQGLLATDLARRSEDGRFGVRLNAARRDGDTAVDGEASSLSMAHIGLDFHEEALRVSADLGFQRHRVEGGQPNITIASGLAIPDAPDAGKSVGQSWTDSDAEDLFGTLRAEYDFTGNITAWVAVGARHGVEEAIFANPTVINEAGDYQANRFDNTREDTVVTGETGVRTRFATGAIGHTLSLSGATHQLKSRNAFAMSGNVITGNIHSPATGPMPPADFFSGGDLDRPGITLRSRAQSVALSDQMSMLDDRLLITLGVRYQTLREAGYDYNTGANDTTYRDSALTPSAGIVYRLTPATSLYANYIEGLQRGGQAPQTTPGGDPVANAGALLDPYRTRQSELGIKHAGERLGGSLSVFRSRKPMDGLDDNDVFRVLSKQENTGVELMAYGLLTRDLTILGGVSLLDADTDAGTAIGSPKTQANLNFEYRVPQWQALTLDTRVIHTSTQYADAANTQKLDAWTRLDLGARYQMVLGETRVLTLRGRIENVTGEDYWASAGGYPNAGYLTVGAPRTLMLSATLDF